MSTATIDLRTDDELVEAATGGNRTAFEELYRRHAESAWGVAMSVTRNRTDAADAVSDAFTRMFQAVEQGRLRDVPFRPYLLTSTRNAAIDILRRSSRVQPTDDVDDADTGAARTAPGPSELAIAGAEAALVAQAFSDLPERWRSVLWLTEVEGLAPREVAEMLGLSANGAAQLAVRARAGLRERYLQAHVAAGPNPSCKFTVDHLGAYVGGGLSARDIAKVDQHLAGCAECRARKEELEDVGSTLRRAIIPLPLFLGGAIFGRMRHASASTGLTSTVWAAHKALAGATAGLLALALVTVGVRQGDSDGGRPPAQIEAEDDRLEVKGFTVTRAPEAVAFSTPAYVEPDLSGLTPFTPPAEDPAPAPAPVAVPDTPAAVITPPAPVVGDAVTEENPPAETAPVVAVAAGDGEQGLGIEIGGTEPIAVSTDPHDGLSVSVAGNPILP